MKVLPNKQKQITASTGTITLVLKSDVQIYYFYGTPTLSGNIIVDRTGGEWEGMTAIVAFDTTMTLNGYTVTVLGRRINDDVASGRFFCFCTFLRDNWHVFYLNNQKGTGGGSSTGGGIGIDADDNYIVKDGAIKNLQINASAAIGWAKMATLTASKVPYINASGVLAASTVTDTELGYISGVTSAIQTQINTKATSGAIANADIVAGAAIAYSKLSLAGAILNTDLAGSIAYSKLVLTGSIFNADINASAAIAYSKMAALTANKVVVTSAAGVPTTSAVSDTEIGYLTGLSSNVQTQIDAANGKTTRASINANTTLTAATIKKSTRIDVTAGAVDITLPAASTLAADTVYEFIQIGAAGAAKIIAGAGDTLNNTSSSGVAFLTCGGAGNKIKLVCDGTNTFYQY